MTTGPNVEKKKRGQMLNQMLYKTWPERKPRKRKKKRSKITSAKLEAGLLTLFALLAFIILLSLAGCGHLYASIPNSCKQLTEVKDCRYLRSSGMVFCVNHDHPDDQSKWTETKLMDFLLNNEVIMRTAQDNASNENCKKDLITWSATHCK